MERLNKIQHCLIEAVECQMGDLCNVDAEELGEVIDMIKDIEEAKYYCAKREYLPTGDGIMKDYQAMTAETHENVKEHAHESSKRHKDHKEKIHDPSKKIEELERYMQEITTDIVDMVKDATPEERQLLHNRIVALGAKIEQLNH